MIKFVEVFAERFADASWKFFTKANNRNLVIAAFLGILIGHQFSVHEFKEGAVVFKDEKVSMLEENLKRAALVKRKLQSHLDASLKESKKKSTELADLKSKFDVQKTENLMHFKFVSHAYLSECHGKDRKIPTDTCHKFNQSIYEILEFRSIGYSKILLKETKKNLLKTQQ